MIKLIALRIFTSSMLVCLLCGCTQSQQAEPGTPAHTRAQALQRAEKYNNLAGKDHTDVAVNHRLKAAEEYVNAGQIDQATLLLGQNTKRALNAENAVYKQIILAQIALAQRNPSAAQKHLGEIWTPLKLPEYLKVRFYATRAETYARADNYVAAVQERVFLDKHLRSAEDKQINNAAIWESLNQLTPDTLNTLQRSNKKDDLHGWISFATITKQYDSSPDQMLRALSAWKENFPNHPAIAFVNEDLLQSENNQQEQAIIAANVNSYSGKTLNVPKKIALLLPLQGSNAQSAQAVRDGFFAAYYAQSGGSSKPIIQVYDTSIQPNISELYQTAVRDGADFIVGPLIKEEVENLNSNTRPDIPVLALNITQKQRSQENIFQFGLAPEMEARAVANKAWRDGHRKAIVIAPKSTWGARMQTAFVDHWQELGGTILATQEVASQAHLNKEVQHLLGIDSSEARAKQLKSLGLKFNFDAHRRQDPDMIFIATNAALARQVKPLLNFYYAANLPAYASSSVFSGKAQPSLDQDLNGIKFCDMPWILDHSVRAKAQYKSVSELWPKEFEQYSRLYALGLDAYRIALQIDQLTLLPDLGISGMTGMLTLDQQQNVQRKLMWATFKRGTPHIEGEHL